MKSYRAAGQRRDQLIVASKITGPGHRGFQWIRGGPRIKREQIHAAIDASLTRLNTDYLDLYQIHWPDRYVPMFGGVSYDAAEKREAEPIAEQLGRWASWWPPARCAIWGFPTRRPGACPSSCAWPAR
jgi:aryl-alcohol dehydrogenase-like predicted oxidoreductase